MLKKLDEEKLSVFERRVLRRIYDPVKENDIWRQLHNRELYERFKDLPIVQLIQINRLRWAGHVQRMAEDRIPKRVMNYLPMGRRRKRRPRTRWLDQVGKEAVRLGAANLSLIHI